MALVLYKCDTCKREISIPRNPRGLETIGRCVITLGCRGKLFQEQLLEDFVRGTIPPDVVGLDNYQQRRVVYDHVQLQSETSWIIEHGLGTFPVVSVFVNSPSQDNPDRRIEITPKDIITIDDDTVRLVFDTAVSGIAQLVARMSDSQLFNPTTNQQTEEALVQLTASSELSIATVADATELRVFFTYITPTGLTVPISIITNDIPSAKSPWTTADRVLIEGRLYTVRSLDPITNALASGLIPDGSRVIFKGISPDTNIPVPIAPSKGQVFFLLASEPYEPPDIDTENLVDAFSVSTTDTTLSMALSARELVVSSGAIASVHPPIRSL